MEREGRCSGRRSGARTGRYADVRKTPSRGFSAAGRVSVYRLFRHLSNWWQLRRISGSHHIWSACSRSRFCSRSAFAVRPARQSLTRISDRQSFCVCENQVLKTQTNIPKCGQKIIYGKKRRAECALFCPPNIGRSTSQDSSSSERESSRPAKKLPTCSSERESSRSDTILRHGLFNTTAPLPPTLSVFPIYPNEADFFRMWERNHFLERN